MFRKMFKPVKKDKMPLYENVSLQIEALIADGNLVPGSQLPPERQLAEIFGVSRTCIREAIKSLSARGLLNVLHGKGIFVADHIEVEQDSSQIINKLFSSDHVEMKDLYEVRKLFEPRVAAWAAARGTQEEAQAILDCVSYLTEANQNQADLNFIQAWELDTKFHLAIARASHNKVILRVAHGMLDLLAESRKNTLKEKGRPLRSMREHLAVAEAIVQGNPAAAEQAMMEHLMKVERELFLFQHKNEE